MSVLGIVIDTSVLIEIEKNNSAVISKLDKLESMKGEIYITSPTYTEFYLGLLKLSGEKSDKRKQRLDNYKILNTTKNSSVLLAEIKHSLSKKGTQIPVFNLFIASIAMDSGMPLITLDNHFKKIQNLNFILI